MSFPTLYKRDSAGKVRTWRMQFNQDGTAYCTMAGIYGGTEVASGWTDAEPKNVGRSNETTAAQQAKLEVEAEYKKKRSLAYFDSIDDIDGDRFYQPMLAHKYEGWTEPVYSQPKLDGMRCIAKADGLWSRKGKPINSVPHIWDALKPYFSIHPDLVLDGELYVHALKNDFEKIMSMVRKQKPTPDSQLVDYHIYDMPSDDGFGTRSQQLSVFINAVKPLVLVKTDKAMTELELDLLYGTYLADGYEGQIIRSLCGTYENKRSKHLLKRKEFKDKEFTIVRIEEGVGNWAGCAKSIVCALPDGREFGSGLKGDQEYAAQVLKEADTYVGKLATVRYFTETADGIPRFPVTYELNRIDS
jgi:ATP-dependent DNA ligase